MIENEMLLPMPCRKTMRIFWSFTLMEVLVFFYQSLKYVEEFPLRKHDVITIMSLTMTQECVKRYLYTSLTLLGGDNSCLRVEFVLG